MVYKYTYSGIKPTHVVIRQQETDFVWNQSLSQLDSWDDDNYLDYLIDPTSLGGGLFEITFPDSLPVGNYVMFVYEQQGDDLEITDSFGSEVIYRSVDDLITPPIEPTDVEIYGSVDDANQYFLNRLHSQDWFAASSDDLAKALIMSTRAIDRLFFKSFPTVITQLLAWPRGGDTLIPDQIKWATYENALALLITDPEREAQGARVLSRHYSSVSTTYNPYINQPWIQMGIMSYVAWTYLLPFLGSINTLKISRVS